MTNKEVLKTLPDDDFAKMLIELTRDVALALGVPPLLLEVYMRNASDNVENLITDWLKKEFSE